MKHIRTSFGFALCGREIDWSKNTGKPCARCTAKRVEIETAPRDKLVLKLEDGKTIGRFTGLSSLVRKQADDFARYWSRSHSCIVQVYSDDNLAFTYNCGKADVSNELQTNN